MYTAFYGLREKPFSLTPDPHFFYLAAPHREALAHVLYGIEQGEGFIAVTGEVGTGKTTLCRTVLERLGPETEVAYIFNPCLDGEELLRAVNSEFGLPAEGRTRAELSEQLNRFLLDMKREDRRVVLIVDEAQNLETSTLEEIRLLSNLETTTSKLIQILLFGQPELDDKLDSQELRQLRQRISVRWSLSPLTAEEVSEYVRHRLRIAAGRECDLFSERALREVRRRARGVPRLVNLLADRALLAGYASGAKKIGPELVSQAAREILKARSRRSSRRRLLRSFFTAAILVVAVAGGAVAWRHLGVEALVSAGESERLLPVEAAPPPAPLVPDIAKMALESSPDASEGVDAPPDEQADVPPELVAEPDEPLSESTPSEAEESG